MDGSGAVKITADTNVLVRSAVQDDKRQAAAATKALVDAELVAVTVPCLCEFCWVLERVYGLHRADVAQAIRALLASGNVAMDRPAVEAGLNVLEAGGDFADGAIAAEGRRLGADGFVSFDKKAVKLLTAAGHAARLLN